MAVFVFCQCGKKFRARDEHAGKRVKCPNCGTALTIPTPSQGLECAVCGATLEATHVAAHGSRVVCNACSRTASKSTQAKLVLAATGIVLLVALAVALWPVLAPKGNHSAEEPVAIAAVAEQTQPKPAESIRETKPSVPQRQNEDAGDQWWPTDTDGVPLPRPQVFWPTPRPETEWGELYVKNESLQNVDFKLRSYVDKSGQTRNPSSEPRWEFEPGEAAYLDLEGKRVSACEAHYTFSTKDGETTWRQEYGGSGRFTIVIEGKNLSKPDKYTRAQIPALMERARVGDAEAQADLAKLYFAGRGVPKNLPEAHRLYRASALQGNARGEYGLGVCYYEGYGVRKDPGEAVLWYRKAASKGVVDAMFNLAFCYSTGSGVRENVPEALRWLDKAAAKGDREAAQLAQELRRPRVTTCSWCDGTGVEACPACSGTGGRGVCGLCHGSGRHRCSVCNGRGYN